MSYNPPDSRNCIKDTLFCCNLPYTYQKLDTPKGHVYNFIINNVVDVKIFNPTNIKVGRKSFRTVRDSQIEIIKLFRKQILGD